MGTEVVEEGGFGGSVEDEFVQGEGVGGDLVLEFLEVVKKDRFLYCFNFVYVH